MLGHAFSFLQRSTTKSALPRTLLLALTALTCLMEPVLASSQNKPEIIGMKHLMVTPDAITQEQQEKENLGSSVNPDQTRLQEERKPPKKKTAEKKAAEKISPTQPPRALSAEDLLIPPDKLENWDKLSLAAYAHNKKDLDALLKNIDLDKDIIPPQGFFLSAKALSDAGKMEDAALYFLVGQLRMEFDMARWPARPDESYEKHQKNNKNKSDDQKQPIGNKPRPINQHAFVMDMSSSIGRPIFDWLASHPKEFKDTLDHARQWDLETRYAYHPGYDLTDPIPLEDWPKALETTRKNFFDRMTKIQEALAGYIGE